MDKEAHLNFASKRNTYSITNVYFHIVFFGMFGLGWHIHWITGFQLLGETWLSLEGTNLSTRLVLCKLVYKYTSVVLLPQAVYSQSILCCNCLYWNCLYCSEDLQWEKSALSFTYSFTLATVLIRIDGFFKQEKKAHSDVILPFKNTLYIQCDPQVIVLFSLVLFILTCSKCPKF